MGNKTVYRIMDTLIGQGHIFLAMVLFSFMLVPEASAQNNALPEGAQTNWIVNDPEEIVSYLIFDPATVIERIPSFLRFISIEELASSDISWAREYLSENPTQSNWGIAFIEIVRMKNFEIDGKSPEWPGNGAAGLWFARVAYTDQKGNTETGTPFLALEYWLPDSIYVSYMRSKGHYASYGDVRLQKKSNGEWLGSIDVEGLHVSCICKPDHNNVSSGSNAIQIIYPPENSGIKDFVRIALAGHKGQTCDEGASWIFEGVHPLVNSILLGSTSFQYGYSLTGGSYHQK
jgi:hypothetical protein